MVLVERDPFVAPLLDAVPSAETSAGCWVFLAGEAGVGKTALVGLLLERMAALPDPPLVRRGSCDGVATPPPLGPVIEALPELESVLEETTVSTRPRLFREVRARLAERPTLLVLEDVHWADEATVELIRFLAARLEGLPLLALVTFREDELGPGDRLTTVMGDLATTRGVVRMQLPTLSPAAVTALVEAAGSPLDPADLHRRTAGNPFFVSEVLAAGSGQVPATVRDAVRARMSRVSPAARDVLAAAAILGPGSRLPLLATVAGRPVQAVDECVRHGLLVSGSGADGLAFRHDIARETVEAGLSPGTRGALHHAALVALTAIGSGDDHRLAHHAAESGNAVEAVRHAVTAAERSARLGAHREAAHEYRLALRFADVHGQGTVADLHDRLSYECYLIDDLDAALAERQRALVLHELDHDLEGVGASQRWLSRVSWFLGRGEDARRYGDQAVATLEGLPPGHELAMALSNKSQLAMLAGHWSGAVEWGNRAIELAHALGDLETEAHALNNVGTAMTLGSDPTVGVARLHQSLDLALTEDLHEHAARAYTNLGASLVRHRRFADADANLAAGIAYSRDRDLDSWLTYMTAWMADSACQQGRFEDTDRLAAEVLRQPSAAIVTRIPALVAAGTSAVRRGDPEATTLLDEARELAAVTGETQRLVPVAVARSEAAWTRGDLAVAAEELAGVREVEHAYLTTWDRGEVSWWLRQAGLEVLADVEVAEPFRLMLTGQWVEAASAWEEWSCPWWQGVSLAHAESLDEAGRANELLRSLGAEATRQALLRERHDAGLPVPRGPRSKTRSNAAGLTAREVDVLALLAEGLTNAQVAGQLFLSPKTVDHHVSALLRKLGEPNRSAAVAAARRRGLLPNLGSSSDVPG